ncbi:MAG: OadG family protein [Bacillota bacterium]
MFGESISFGEGLIVTALGMGVTFAALIALSFLLDLLRIIFYKEPKKAPVQVVETPAEAVVETVEENEEELIAVITAAVAAAMETTTHNIIVRNIVRVGDNTPSWGRMGRIEQMNSRY